MKGYEEMKRLMSFLLSFALVFALTPNTIAASDEAIKAANALYVQGLFKGTGTNDDGTPIFDLDKTPTRNQAIIMLVRLLGKEDEALAGTWNIPFTDVSDNMRPYIGYAYTNGLTNGITVATYGGNQPISANQYIAFVLRSLGYVSGTDFVVPSATDLSNQLGITNEEYDNANSFTRGDVAIISLNSLKAKPKEISSIPPKNQANNTIPDEEIVNITTAYVALLKEISGINQIIDTLENITSFDKMETNVAAACVLVRTSIEALKNIVISCKNYDDTQVLKTHTQKLLYEFQGLYTGEQNFLSNSLDENFDYLKNYLTIVSKNSETFTLLENDMKPFIERVKQMQ